MEISIRGHRHGVSNSLTCQSNKNLIVGSLTKYIPVYHFYIALLPFYANTFGSDGNLDQTHAKVGLDPICWNFPRRK